MSSIGSTTPDPHQLSLLQASARNNDRKVRELVEGQPWVTEMDRDALRLSLQKVALRGNVSLARFLIEKGAEVNAARQELSALYKAAEKGHAAMVRLLLEYKADTEARDRLGRTPLFLAASNGHVGVARVLLEANSNVDARDHEGETPLVYLAAEQPAPEKSGKHKPLKWGLDMIDLLFEQNAEIEACDNKRRTALLWAAAGGKLELVKLLLSGKRGKRSNISAFNDRGKTALHLAVENNNEQIVKLLLDEGASPMARSDGGWTPFHIACEKGHEELVAILLASRADINAQTSSGMTGLHWAAHYGHEAVVRMIMSRPDAKLSVKDSFDSTPMIRAAQKGNIEIVQLLSPVRDGPRLQPHARDACKQFKATIVDFWSSWSNHSKCTVYDLLYGWDEEEDKPLIPTLAKNIKAKPSFRWIHLPANNVAWVETLLTKSFIEDGARDVDDFKALEKFFSQEHRGPTIHSHFMRPFCRGISTNTQLGQLGVSPRSGVASPRGGDPSNSPKPAIFVREATPSSDKDASKSGKKAKSEKYGRKGSSDGFALRSASTFDSIGSKSNKNTKPIITGGRLPEFSSERYGKVVLFMPYLHYETHTKRETMSHSIKEANLWMPPDAKFTPDENLIRGYIHNSPPLHPRRTLDQFFYHGIDTDDRDRDQVVYRYCKRHFQERKVFMVDQLWMWILGKGTIITSFPQRWDQPKNDPLSVLDGIIEDMNSKTRPPVKSVHDLALLITDRVAGVFDRHRLADEGYQFLDMFESSIGHVTNQETKLFHKFNGASRKAAAWLKLHRRSRSSRSRSQSPRRARETSDGEEDDPRGSTTNFVDDLLDIGVETKLLAETKDIKDELNMISMVLKHQHGLLPELAEVMCEDLGGKRSNPALEVKRRSKEQIKVIDTYLKDVDRMDKQADGIYTSLTHLLDLKQKHANAFEARFAREQADLTARQGQTIMVFTIVTIVFLPMSFIAAFFAINFDDFHPEGLKIDYVAKYTFGIGLAISLPLITLALSVENVGAFIRRIFVGLHKKFFQKKPGQGNEKDRIDRYPNDQGPFMLQSAATREKSTTLPRSSYQYANGGRGLAIDGLSDRGQRNLASDIYPVGFAPYDQGLYRSTSRRTEFSWRSRENASSAAAAAVTVDGRFSGDLERGGSMRRQRW